LYAADSQPQAGDPIQLLNYASVLATSGVASNILLAIAEGVLYQNVSGAMAAVTGGPQFNTTATQLQGTQVGTLFYIADYRATNLTGTDGTIASTNRLSATSISNWTTAGVTTADVVWISGSVDIESNIFPITSIAGNGSYLTFTGTMTNQTGGVTWQIGRIPRVFNPAAPTAALTGLMGTLPITASHYNVGLVTIANGLVALSGSGASWAGVPQATVANLMTLTIPNASGIGTQDYAVAVGSVVSGGSPPYTQGGLTLVDTTADATCTNASYTLSWTSTYYGIPPLGCRLCCTYRGRLVLAGPGAVWYMSRILDPNDWDYGYDPADPARAVAGASTTTGGVPDPILALMPHSDQYLIFGCERSLWLLTGDPAYGGTITALSREIGVLGPGAWCNLPDGSMVILSRDGLYQISAGASSYPAPISRPLLPAELLNVDWVNNTISMCYDVWARGIHIAVTPVAGTIGVHYFLDWTTKSFWPVTLPNAMQPTAILRYAPNSTVAAQVVVGGFDGYLRDYSPTATTDDGTAFTSLVSYGPFRIGGPGYYGEILQIAADLDSNGQGVAWGVFHGDNAQVAVAAAVAAGAAAGAIWQGTWTAGANHRQFPRACGAAFVIMVNGTYGWAIEGLRIEGKQKGVIR
jgi:hypothetical protein